MLGVQPGHLSEKEYHSAPVDNLCTDPVYFLENIVRYVNRGIPSLTGRQENLKLVASRGRSTLRRNYELPMVMVGLIGLATSAFALSVEEAYRLIPHQRTVFQPASARMTASEQAY